MSVTELELTDEELDEEIDEYLTVAFSNGFSKGTANVSAKDMKRLSPLLRHYAKKPHPFRACVRDQIKHGLSKGHAERRCAVIKDLIHQSTKWRKGRKKKVNMSQDEVAEFILHEVIDDEFVEWLMEMSEEDMEEYARLSQGGDEDDDVDLPPDEEVELGETLGDDPVLAEMYFGDGDGDEEGGLVWKTILREGEWQYAPGPGQKPVKKPITVVKTGKSDPEKMVISMSEIVRNFKNGAVEHVQVPTSHSGGVLDNTGFAKDLKLVKGEDGKYELKAALDFTEPDVKDKTIRGTIANSSAGILFNFIRKQDGKKFGAVLDHVALTNRPWLNGLKPFGTDFASEEVDVLHFAEDALDLAHSPHNLRNIVDGLRMAIESEEDEKYRELLEGAHKSAVQVLVACEKSYKPGGHGETAAAYSDDHRGGGDEMADTEKKEEEKVEAKADTFLSELGLSEDEAKSRLAEYDQLRRDARERAVKDKIRTWEEGKKAPGMIKEAERILLADEGVVVLNLSSDGGPEGLTATQLVERLMEAAPSIELSQKQVTDRELAAGEKHPGTDADNENEDAKLSLEVRSEAARIFLAGEAESEEDALDKAKAKFQDKDGK